MQLCNGKGRRVKDKKNDKKDCCFVVSLAKVALSLSGKRICLSHLNILMTHDLNIYTIFDFECTNLKALWGKKPFTYKKEKRTRVKTPQKAASKR